MFRSVASVVVLAVALAVPSDAREQGATIHFRVLAQTAIRLTDIAWTGDRILYVENTTNAIWSAPPAGKPLTRFASLPRQVEEMRCRVSPGSHGWAPGLIFCHAPGNTIYRLSADGRDVTAFAKLPETAVSDGALTFDTAGAFGYGLVAATGRSGTKAASGGDVYAIAPSGTVRRVGHYSGPGGADEVAIAPAGFGRMARSALLTVDRGPTGRLVAMNAAGTSTVVARFPDGPNPIAVIAPSPVGGGANAGLYLTDTLSKNAYVAPVADLRAYEGDVIVGSELRGLFWAVRPSARGYVTTRVPTTLRGGHYNLEGMAYVSR